MIHAVINFSLKNRGLIIMGWLLVVGAGISEGPATYFRERPVEVFVLHPHNYWGLSLLEWHRIPRVAQNPRNCLEPHGVTQEQPGGSWSGPESLE